MYLAAAVLRTLVSIAVFRIIVATAANQMLFASVLAAVDGSSVSVHRLMEVVPYVSPSMTAL